MEVRGIRLAVYCICICNIKKVNTLSFEKEFNDLIINHNHIIKTTSHMSQILRENKWSNIKGRDVYRQSGLGTKHTCKLQDNALRI